MAEAYINAQRQALLYAQDFMAASPGADMVVVSHGGVRLTLDRSGAKQVDRTCTGCLHNTPESCAALFPEEPCYQAKAAA